MLSTISPKSGRARLGRPLGTSPINSTPSSPRSNNRVAAMPRMTATNAPGTFGAKIAIPNTRISDSTPTSKVVRFVSDRLATQSHNFCHVLSPDFSVPVILNNSPEATLIATPNVNPVNTAADRNSDTQPILRTHITMNSSPATNTIAAATATASSEFADANDSTAAPSTAAVDELGPCVTCFEVVNKANAINPAAAAYSPYCTGTPLIVAYPSEVGTISAQTDNPAITSVFNHDRSYFGSHETIGR